MLVFCMRTAARCCCASMILLAPLGAPAAAERPLTLQQAVERTLARNPDLNAFSYAIQAQEGVLQQAQASPNPEVGLLVENVLGSGQRSDFDSAETTLSLGFALERGARERRIERRKRRQRSTGNGGANPSTRQRR